MDDFCFGDEVYNRLCLLTSVLLPGTNSATLFILEIRSYTIVVIVKRSAIQGSVCIYERVYTSATEV